MVERNELASVRLAYQMQLILVHAGADVLLKEALRGGAFGAAQEAQWPADDVRADPIPHHRVIIGQALLGNPGILPIDPIRMCQGNAVWRCSRHGLSSRSSPAGQETECQALALTSDPRQTRSLPARTARVVRSGPKSSTLSIDM